MLKYIWNKLQHLIKHSYISNTQQDGQSFYNAQIVSYGGASQSIIYHPYGMTTCPPINSMGITLSGSGYAENKMTLPYSTQYRWTGLQNGEVQLGNPVSGTYIKFDKDGNVTIYTPNKQVNITGDTTITGTLTVSGATTLQDTLTVNSTSTFQDNMQVNANITATGTIQGGTVTNGTISLSDVQTTFNAHVHTSATPGQPTSAPTTPL